VADRNQVSEKKPTMEARGLFNSERLLFHGADARGQIEDTKALPGLLQRL
jgi:hypothetical protein